MAVTNKQAAVQAAAISNPAAGAAGGTAANTDVYADAYNTWLEANDGTDADDARAALLGAAMSIGDDAQFPTQVTAKASVLLDEIESRTLLSIAVTPGSGTKAHPDTQQYVATGTYRDGSTGVITTRAAWASSDATNATIGAATGLATTVSTGPTNITAAYDGVTSNTVVLTVT